MMRFFPQHRTFLLFTSFLSGASIMSIELCASRVLAPGFGGSIYVWGSLIGVIMAALSFGYYLGGKRADRSKDSNVIFASVLFAAVAVAVSMALSEPVVILATQLGIIWGPISASVVLFFAPMAILSMVSPAVIRFSARDMASIGESAGQVYAISTIGSILGTFATAFMLLPFFGTRMTLILNAVLLAGIGIAGLSGKKPTLYALLIIPCIIAVYQGASLSRVTGTLVYSAESEYNIIHVYETPEYIMLMLNDENYMQTIMMKGEQLSGGYYNAMSVGPAINNAKRVLFLGLAGGTVVRQMHGLFDVKIDAVEIDPKVVEVARRYFGLKQDRRLRIHVSDGRQFVRTAGSYDIIAVDTFNGGNIPAHMASREFFAEMSDHLTEDGLVMMNVVNYDRSGTVADALARTMKSVFPQVFVVPMGGNSILIGSRSPRDEQYIKAMIRANDRPILKSVTGPMADALYAYDEPGMAALTDDKSDIEELTFNAMRHR
jgi:spermidine synthase